MPSTILEVLDELYSSAKSERDKGDKFERLVRSYLTTDLMWRDRFDDVWLWAEWDGRGGKVDTGIDLVARERETGGYVAIQCKCYDLDHTLQKGDIDSFFTASGTAKFSGRLIVSTTAKWSQHAEAALNDQQIPVTRLDIRDLDESSIDWSKFSFKKPEVLTVYGKKQLRPHQREAADAAVAHFANHDRGRLIMACGTGKTFTSLRIAEQLVPGDGNILFLVPSISLLAQTLREWTIEAADPIKPFAVCSDAKVGRDSEDIAVHDLPFPASTDGTKLAARINDSAGSGRTVVFSTYQSLPAVAAAQHAGMGEFDLVVCDEAHRTTGLTLAGEDESNFVRVHDSQYLRAKRRMYMTATPRIYGDDSKKKAAEGAAELASMDSDAIFGPEFHRLGFGEAVSRDLLTDYKVLVLAVDEKAVSKAFQAQLADKNSELGIDDAARIVGCWNGLAKRGHLEFGFGSDDQPMRRAVAFARSIKDSKRFESLFTEIVSEYTDSLALSEDSEAAETLQCEVQHVDGTFNVLRRNEKLTWLKGSVDDGECRILTNARCLSEGVDVPALDAVMFLNPRKSVVDVVQSVGRVMRKTDRKQYGYVILPIGIPANMTPEEALADNEKYKVVWQVLQALRAHDERFNALVNKLDLNKTSTPQLQVIGIGDWDEDDSDDPMTPKNVQGTLQFPQLVEWRDAIYAKIVKKVGDRRYWETWASDVTDIASKHTTRINALLDDPKLSVQDQFQKFLTGLRANLNDSITREDAIDMLAQHLITKPVFEALFDDYSFADHNPVSQVMQEMLDALHDQNFAAEQAGLERFYESVRTRAAGVDTAEGKQRIITDLYEKFFKIAFPRMADKLGIVYTPVEVVDFILRSVEHVLNAEFDASLTDEGVHVLDPFTGTGTFVARLLQSGHIRSDDLARKYASELHANEILLLAYYIAAINVEATYHGLTGEGYTPFDGIVLTDTFQIAEAGDLMDEVIFPRNNARVAQQKTLDIRVIVGNPPYSVGQTSQNDANQNLDYPTLDAKIEATYAALSTSGLKRNLYDSYIRAIRWASDRIASSEHGGVIGYVSNGGWIESGSFDGLRKTLAREFHAVYVFNLRGNQRTSGEQSRKEGGKVFGKGSRNTVAISLLVKKPGPVPASGATINLHDIGDYLSREEKLARIDEATLANLPWVAVTPDAAGYWNGQQDAGFEALTPMAGRKGEHGIFDAHSVGVTTNRDAWAYNYSRPAVASNMERMIANFNHQVDAFTEWSAAKGGTRDTAGVESFLDRDPRKVSWSRSLKDDVRAGRKANYAAERVVVSLYRPFCKQWVYLDSQMNEAAGVALRAFPTQSAANRGILVAEPSNRTPFSVLMTDVVPDSKTYVDAARFFARYIYVPADVEQTLFDDEAEGTSEGWQRVDNISDVTLLRYRKALGTEVSKDDVFHYVYGVLHSPDYRATFATDLRRSGPRIPDAPTAEVFRAFSEAGSRLAELHVGYESAEPYPLEAVLASSSHEEFYSVERLAFGRSGKAMDRSTIVVNSRLSLAGIPSIAHEYQLGTRSALEWVIDRYQVRTDKASGIVNDPNDWAHEHGDPRYIVDLVKRVVTVSVKTVEIVQNLPPLALSTEA